MTEYKEYNIRHGSVEDIEKIAELEHMCFPKEEAASKEAFQQRLEVYGNHFWLLESENQLLSMVNGMVTDEENLADVMYQHAELHNEQGKWQMIFGVETHPEYQRRGLAEILLKAVIEEVRAEKRAGLVLTCKERLLFYYEKFGFVNEGISSSEHGNAEWYQMRLSFEER